MQKKDNGRVVTSIRIDPEIWREARVYAIKNGLTVGVLVEKLLKKEIKKV